MDANKTQEQRTESLFDNLRRLARKAATSPGAATVHRLRTTIRRVETLLAAAVPQPGRKEKKLLKQLDRVRKRAGRVRDLDVQLAALKTLRMDSMTGDRRRVARDLERARARREAKLIKALEQEFADGLAERLKRVTARLSGPSPHAQQPRDSFLAEALDRFAALSEKRATLTEDILHGFRMECKRLRYLAEMSGETPEAHAVVGLFKRIQDGAGEWHDWMTLTGTAERVLPQGARLISVLRTNTRARFLEASRIIVDARKALLDIRRQPTGRKRPRAVESSAVERAGAATA